MINKRILENMEPFDGASETAVSIAIGSNAQSKSWETIQIPWPKLVTAFSKTLRTSETYAEYLKSEDEVRKKIKDVGGFVGGALTNKLRQKEFLHHRSLLTFDWDTVDIPANELIGKYESAYGYEAAWYASHTHNSKKPRLRLVIPVSRDITGEEYQAITRKMAQKIGMEMIDPASFRIVQLMYWPSTASDGEFVFKHNPGTILDPDDILNEYADPMDMSEWPMAPKENPKVQNTTRGSGQHHSGSHQDDPLKKGGLIGAFCRAYTVPEAIDSFLSHKFIPTNKTDRYTYAGASTKGGAVIYDNIFLYSNHGTDPFSDRLLNAYDLVRLHIFGDSDTSKNKMMKLIQTDTKVKETTLQEELGDEMPEKSVTGFITIDGRGEPKVDPILLAQYIRETQHYRIVRKNGQDSDLLYWYEGGSYKQTSPNEFKGRIKIPIPQSLRKASILEEAYKDLITDLNTTDFEELNKDDRYINFRNGLYEIKSQKLVEHSPDLLYTRQIPYDWNPQAANPSRFLKYLDELTNGDMALQMDIQEYLGLTLSSMPGYLVKKAMVLYGVVGNSGKTQLTKVIADLLGREYIANTPLQKLSDRFALSELIGTRCLLVDDQKAGDLKDSSSFKTMVGGGYLTMEIKGKTPFSWRYDGTYIITTNEMPYIQDDKGTHMFERFMIIPCDNVIPSEKRDPFLFDKIRDEMPGVIKWCIDGLHRLISNEMKLTNSRKADEALEKFRLDNDPLRAFISERCIVGNPGDRVLRSLFITAYQSWCYIEERKPLSKKNVTHRMEQNGFCSKKVQGDYYYEPIRLDDLPLNW